jgi:hypothetical protein
VYCGVHYPTDVVGGAGLGLALGSLWRGPVAAANRGLIKAGWRVALPVLRALSFVALGVRVRRRAAEEAPEEKAAAA